MFNHWQIGDWIGVAAIIAPFLVGGIVHSLMTARKLGKFESGYDQMKAQMKVLVEANDDRRGKLVEFKALQEDVLELQVEAKKYSSVDTALQLLQQGMGTMAGAFADLRLESRTGRAETQSAIAELKEAFGAELREVRHDVRNLMTGKIMPARRATGGS